MKVSAYLLVFLSLFSLSACNIQRLAVKQTGGIIEKGFPVFYQETDLRLAEVAIASNIKLLETLLATAPNDRRLLLATSQACTAYAFAFVESEMEQFRFADPQRSEEAKERAKSLYLRGRDYAKRALAVRHKKLVESFDKSLDDFDPLLEKIRQKSVPELFWLAFSWGGYINLSKDSITEVADIVKVEHMMKRILRLDENYFNAGPHLFLGVYYGSRPRMFGGDPKLSQYHFDKVDTLNRNRLLMGKVLRAEYLSVQEQDRKNFDLLLAEVKDAKEDLYPEQALMNKIAKVRAEIVRKQANQLF